MTDSDDIAVSDAAAGQMQEPVGFTFDALADLGTLTVPKYLWSPPVPEAQWGGTRPRLPATVPLLPAAALVLAYLSAVTAAASCGTAGGVLLFAAFIALVWFGAALVRFAYRRVRYWQEAPR